VFVLQDFKILPFAFGVLVGVAEDQAVAVTVGFFLDAASDCAVKRVGYVVEKAGC
jgi:hypothetical protein